MPEAFLICAIIVMSVSSSFAAHQAKIFKELTESEKELVEDSGISVDKLEILQQAGISVEEYFQYPWIEHGISEKEWVNQRKAGIISSDQPSIKQIELSEWAVVQNFFLPGFHQFKRQQHLKGFLMSGIAVTTLALYAVHT